MPVSSNGGRPALPHICTINVLPQMIYITWKSQALIFPAPTILGRHSVIEGIEQSIQIL